MASGPLDPDEAPIWLAKLWNTSLSEDVIAGVDEDDCAVLFFSDSVLVATTDFLNASPIALQLGLGDLYDLGRLLVAANLSDLCGTGAKPRALLTAITMERGSSQEDFQRLALGIDEEARRWKVPVVGGDTKLGAPR
jgi:thiamine-monophosphate kinase